jgi:predicted DCC family thiol-disulfide oxidoreductase YuxK
MSKLTEKYPYLAVYDGECGLCAKSVQFILRHDAAGRFRFSPIQSILGQAVCAEAGIDPTDPSSFIAIVDGRVHTKSRAVLQVAMNFGGAWKLWGLFRLVPTRLADLGYDWVARRRRRLFPSASQCLVSPELRARIVQEP